MSRWLCTLYEGPGTWETPRDEWCDPDECYAREAIDAERAAERYAAQAFDHDSDPAEEQEIAVEDATTGQRWVVEVHGEIVIEWHGTASEVDPATGEVQP